MSQRLKSQSQDVTGNCEFEQPQRDSAGDEDNSTVEGKAQVTEINHQSANF